MIMNNADFVQSSIAIKKGIRASQKSGEVKKEESIQ